MTLLHISFTLAKLFAIVRASTFSTNTMEETKIKKTVDESIATFFLTPLSQRSEEVCLGRRLDTEADFSRADLLYTIRLLTCLWQQAGGKRALAGL